MKIVFITIAAPFSRKETYIVEELRNICRLKCEVFIFPLTKSTKEITASNKISALSYRACFSKNFKALIGQLIRKPFRIFYSFLHLAIIQKPKRFFYTLYILPKILQLTDWIEKEQIDHIHAYWGTTPATCAMIASELTQVPFSFTIHRADIISNDILAYKSERALFVRSISNWGKELAIKLGADQDKIKIIHFGVNIPRILLIKKRTKEINIVCVGELIRHKRIYELIERIAKLKKINLFIFGDGREKSRIKRMIRRSNLSGNIKLLGTVTPKMLFGFYESRKFDLFILPSKIEGIPVAAMEAMAYSIPVAITKVGGSGELINNQNGYVLKQDFSNLEKILNKCPEPEKITKAYLRVKEEFNVNKTSLKLFNTIKKYAKKNKKTIWIINQYAVSPQLPGGTRHYDFAKELTRKNLNIIIFTSGFNNFDKKESLKYDNGGVFPEQVGKSLKFIWIKTPRYRKNNILRVRNIFIFAKNLRKIISDFIKPDLIIGSSPNLIASYQAYKIARFMKVPFIFEVRDIWPQNLIELGANKLNPFIIYLRYIEKILMIKSDRIVSLMPYFANYAQKKFKVSSKKISWISNGVSEKFIKKQRIADGINNHFAITYAGTIGVAQNFEIIIQCAKELLRYKKIKFIIIGDGTERQKIIALKDKLNLSNIMIKNSISKNKIFKELRKSDVLLFSQKKAAIYSYGQPPNKIFDYMAASRPIIFASSAKNNLIKEANCGISIRPESPEELAKAIIRLYNMSPIELQKMGKNGQKFVKKYYSIKHLAEKYYQVISELT